MSEPQAAAAASDEPEARRQAISPYAAGGGGSTFGHRVAAIYLAHGLLSLGRTETDDLPIMRVEFQTNPAHDVDDLLVIAGTGDDEVRLSVAARRAPTFVTSHAKTRELVASLVREVEAVSDDERARVVVAVADWKAEYGQVQQLAELARGNADEDAFYTQLHTERRWDGQVRDRYGHLKNLVSAGRMPTPTEGEARLLTWQLLRRLWTIQFRVEAANESDWSQIANLLNRLAREGCTGAELRDRLVVCCTQFDSLGTVVDMGVVRREVHTLLEATAIRRKPGWDVLDSMKRHAYEAVRYTLGPDSDSSASITIKRAKLHDQLADTLLDNGAKGKAVVVSGDSGTGKSSLVLSVIKSLEVKKAESFEALVVNLRRLPGSVPELTSVLGASLREFLEDLSAPSRVLVVDGADGVLEGRGPLLAEIASEARQANVGLAVVTADTAAEFVTDQVKRSYGNPLPCVVPVLDDAEIATIAAGIPQLAGLLRDLPERSLLRRLVVLDLLSRTGLTLGSSMTDWACLEVVWKGLVRRNESAEFGSPEARERALLSLAEDELRLPGVARRHPLPDPAAVDALRRDHLLAPPNVYDSHPQFAHDEVRRYATALTLFRSKDIIGVLENAGVPRWAMSAAQLACHGQFVRGSADPSTAFTQAAAAFMTIGVEHGARWADVPIEAALDSPQAFEYLRSVQPGAASASAPGLEDVLRVVEQRHTANGLPEVQCGEAVVRVLLEQDDTPWLLSKRAFETIAGWLQSMVVAKAPTGVIAREILRGKLFAYWAAHQTPLSPSRRRLDVPHTVDSSAMSHDLNRRRDRRRNLDYRLKQEDFVELLALLGADIDDDVERCLTEIADDAPERLAPAVDSPLSAQGVAQHNVDLLVKLAEAYYIDDHLDRRSFRDQGIRRHQGRWHHFSPPFAAFYFGAFWPLFNYADPVKSAAVLNKVLNHAARCRVEDLFGRRGHRPAPDGENFDKYTVSLRISGEVRSYISDAGMWAWYRGASDGPYPCMSALQAMERVIDGWLKHGVPMSKVVEVLLDSCENLAVPALLVGVMVRHLDKANGVIDFFLREPLVWHLEFGRMVQERVGLRSAPSDGLVNTERRTWTFREVCMAMVLDGDESRREELRHLGAELIAAGQKAGMAEEVANWAIYLDASRFQVRSENEQLVVEVSLPEELAESQAERVREHERNSNVLRIQNRYWAVPRHVGAGYVPPTSEEIAADLAQAKDLLDLPPTIIASSPMRGAAHVASTAIRHAADGQLAAFGENAVFAVELMMAIAFSFEGCEDEVDEGQGFAFGADHAAANALPCLLLPALETTLADAGFTRIQVNTAALAMASESSLETRLHLARGCDRIWRAPCTSEPCIHTIAFEWVTEAARGVKIGPWDAEGGPRPRVRIDGSLAEGLADLDGNCIDTRVLDAAIRGYGAAAEGSCVSKRAAEQLNVLIQAQREGMLVQNEQGWSVDDHGAQSLVTARALLQTSSGGVDSNALVGHLTALSGSAFLLSNFLHELGAAGAETAQLAESARRVWPTVMKHVMTFADTEPNPFIEHTWGEWALAALIPQPLVWTNGLFNEVDANPIDWVVPGELLEAIPEWVRLAHGSRRCLDDLISLIRRLSIREQVELGLRWVADICVRERNVGVYLAWSLDEWLIELRPHTEAFGRLSEWQRLVDRLVVAGNQRLARYSV